jgi:plastocyanin
MMIKKIVVTLLLCSAALMLFVACGGAPGGTTGNTSTSGSSNAVHMSAQVFVQSSITISKGSSITLVDDVGVPHNIANGTWDNNNAKPMKETNVPSVNVQLNGNDQQTIGPFAAAGTYHLYCTIHPGMNLTVIVQ